MVIFITGGARSGKSRFAEACAARLASSGEYIATAQLYDREMEERARMHQDRRTASGFAWRVHEEPYELAALLRKWSADSGLGSESSVDMPDQTAIGTDAFAKSEATTDAEARTDLGHSRVILIDCLTLWLSNWLLRLEGENRLDELEDRIEELCSALEGCPYPVLAVSNEVGDGIVPEYPLGRLFRDYAGLLNQRVARLSNRAFLVTAGIPVDLKRLEFRLDEL
ncbi:bifunctional adenosylcobinamide kinase/adenosylcobinamide-phosphate guanylyltransferase [Gorillibacterium timonense]|uniref:bifunctional adenosylcobinamide kinase/adenosylcobinamide-phosphate guanylyltransferase n=1 Tax=Gorillibacterium timonense TaxID=1689269 RepID=UPI00071D44D7|nr:bifunctional adenosylcobinamide kinase/adenosylcobinamide-phosphate guanylyltransferase [Gorillibacterium timonense]